MAKAKEQFEEFEEDAVRRAVGELEGQTDDPTAENYVDPSVEQIEGEEEEQEDRQGVALGLHPFGVQVQVTSRFGDVAVATITVEEAHRLAGSLLDLTAFHTMMGIQAQMAEQHQVAKLMSEERTKSGIIVKR